MKVFIKTNASKKKCVKHSLLGIRGCNECYEKYNRNKFNPRCYREPNIVYNYLKKSGTRGARERSARDEKRREPDAETIAY